MNIAPRLKLDKYFDWTWVYVALEVC
jgi:hypothetical protein